MPEPDDTVRSYNLLVYGMEMLGYKLPEKPLRKRNFTVNFGPIETAQRFQEFDGVIMFEDTFVRMRVHIHPGPSKRDKELEKREKEARELINKDGFLCLLLNQGLEEMGDDGSSVGQRAHTLAKFCIPPEIRPFDFQERMSNIHPVLDELKAFLALFGSARSRFDGWSADCRSLARVGQDVVGLLYLSRMYLVPSMEPDNNPKVIDEYFELLAGGITSIHGKLQQALPAWIEAYRFEEEGQLGQEIADREAELARLRERTSQLERYKSALSLAGPPLVPIVGQILEICLGLAVDDVDELEKDRKGELREDLQLVGEDGQPIALIEVKGVNGGVRIEDINQTDSHREIAGFDRSFPAILIINTAIKSARSIGEKDQTIARERIKQARNQRVLILRTLDLLSLLRLTLAGKLKREAARALLLQNIGWLRVCPDGPNVVTGDESAPGETG